MSHATYFYIIRSGGLGWNDLFNGPHGSVGWVGAFDLWRGVPIRTGQVGNKVSQFQKGRYVIFECFMRYARDLCVRFSAT